MPKSLKSRIQSNSNMVALSGKAEDTTLHCDHWLPLENSFMNASKAGLQDAKLPLPTLGGRLPIWCGLAAQGDGK